MPTMSSIKKAIHRARTSVSNLSSRSKSPLPSPTSQTTNGKAHPLLNGDAKAANGVPQIVVDNTNAQGETAAQEQQQNVSDDPRQTNHLQRPSTNSRSRRLSFTEQKAERRDERRGKDEEEDRARKERQKKLYDEVRLRCVRLAFFMLTSVRRTRCETAMATYHSTCPNKCQVLASSKNSISRPGVLISDTESRLHSLIGVASMNEGEHVTFQARVHHIRPLGMTHI